MTIQEITLSVIQQNNLEVVITRSNRDMKSFNVVAIDSFANIVYTLGSEITFEDAVELQAPFIQEEA